MSPDSFLRVGQTSLRDLSFVAEAPPWPTDPDNVKYKEIRDRGRAVGTALAG